MQVYLNMEIKNYNEFFALVTLLQGYFEVKNVIFFARRKDISTEKHVFGVHFQ